MNKVLSFLVVSFMGMSVFGAAIPQESLGSYQAAVNLSLAQHPLTCVFTPSGSIFSFGSLEATISATTSGEFSTDGNQPLLKFFYSAIDTNRLTLTVATSEDRKTVLSIKGEQQEATTAEVNEGTIDKPVIVEETVWTTDISLICQ